MNPSSDPNPASLPTETPADGPPPPPPPPAMRKFEPPPGYGDGQGTGKSNYGYPTQARPVPVSVPVAASSPGSGFSVPPSAPAAAEANLNPQPPPEDAEADIFVSAVPAFQAPQIPTRRSNTFVRLWRRIGAGSLALSVLIHAALIIGAGMVVMAVQNKDEKVDFLPGGGTRQGAAASDDLAHKVQQKQRSKINNKLPFKRIVTDSLTSSVTLPDAPVDALDVPDISQLISGKRLGGGSLGMGTAGAGGGFSTGMGKGALAGMTFKPIMMFGMELKDARKIAVVMDVSRSMTKYLPVVAKELDRVAFGSPLVLYFGCGLKTPPRDIEDKVRKVGTEGFDKFWYFWEGKQDMKMLRTDYKKLKYEPGKPMPLNGIYQQMVKRPNTYYIDFNGITFTSSALTSKEVMEADTIYWFADFQDAVDVKEIEEVVKKLRSRKQKLYMHASLRGRSFELVRDNLVKPLGGDVIETKAE